MTDIVERLRDKLPMVHDGEGMIVDDDAVLDTFSKAADEIERLREALRPFAKCSEVYPKAISSWPASFAGVNDMDCPLTIGDFHRARTALGEKE